MPLLHPSTAKIKKLASYLLWRRLRERSTTDQRRWEEVVTFKLCR
jgi:hypothetical protein